MQFDYQSAIINPVPLTAPVTLGGSAGIIVPTGTTGNRPASPANGCIRYSSTLNSLEAYVNNSWIVLGSAAIQSISLSATPSIFTVTGSPLTSSGTITLSLSTQVPKVVLASDATAPLSVPTFRTISLENGYISDVTITSPTQGQVLRYDGNIWENTNILSNASSGLIGVGQTSPANWTSMADGYYYAHFVHNLNTSDIHVTV